MNNKKHILSPKERRMIYIDYLKENNGASTSEFQSYLKENYNVEISRGTLSEDRKHLEKMNYKFATRNGKYILTEESSDVQNFSYKETQKFTSCIDKDLFLDWLLLYEGREKANSFGKSDLADNDGVLRISSHVSFRNIYFNCPKKVISSLSAPITVNENTSSVHLYQLFTLFLPVPYLTSAIITKTLPPV